MNFKKNWKRFWTLSSAREGFTLVELIVVIAILAILAGVAVPAYSGYVTKANMQADITLISEIEHALTLAGYNGTFENEPSGYITLSATTAYTSEQAGEGSALDIALKAAFGENYSLQLKYDGWGTNGLYDNLTPETAFAVKQSSYLTGNRANDLLADVEIMTGMASNLVTVLASGNSFLEGTTLSSMFTKADGTCALDATAAKYGITKDANETWEQWAAKNDGANQTAYSNLLVLTAADESEKYMSGVLGTGVEYEMSGASNMILEFSSFYAYAATNPEFSETLDSYMAHLNGETTDLGLAPVTDASTGAAWYNALKAAAGSGYDTYIATAEDGQAFIDNLGFLSIMAGLGNPSDEQASQVGADINNANLFTNGIVNSMYNDYLDGVSAMSGLYDPEYDDYANWSLGLGDGNVAVLFTQNGTSTVIKNTLPST